MLTSSKNPRIRQIRKLQNSARARRSDQLFVVEGVRLVEEILIAGWVPETVYFTEDLNARGQKIVADFRTSNVEVTPVASHVMQAASDTQTPQGILAVLPFRHLPLPANPDFLVILDGIRDPGNLGAILRTAVAAGVEGIFLSPGTADPFAPKVVRAAMGAHFRLPIYPLDWDQIHELISTFILTHYLADSSGGRNYYQCDFCSPTALMIGGEAAGAGREAGELTHIRIHIEMPGKAESLNAATAAAILMFEVVRQRQVLFSSNPTQD